MTQSPPVGPPAELIRQWEAIALHADEKEIRYFIATKAAEWKKEQLITKLRQMASEFREDQVYGRIVYLTAVDRVIEAADRIEAGR